MKRHQRIIHTLTNMLSAYDSGHRAKHIAALVKRNRIVAVGYNTMKTSPAVLKFSGTHARTCIHAEVDVLGKVNDAQGMSLYVVRVDRNGQLAMSCPCQDCYRAIHESGVKKIIYTTDTGYHVSAIEDLEPYQRALRCS